MPFKTLKRLFCKYIFAIVFLLPVPSALAAGFYLQEQSAVAMGTAFAGASAHPRNASIIYYNPAGMAELDGGQLSLNVDTILAEDDMIDQGSTLLGAPITAVDSDNAIPGIVIGNFYLAFPMMDGDLWAGFGVSTPFGLATKYNSNWFGRYDSTESELITLDLQPSIAYRVNDWFSIGGGIDFQYIDAELKSVVTNGVSEGQSKLIGQDWSIGYNIGFMMEPYEDTRLGVHYRSRVYHELDGRVLVTGVAGLNEDVGGKAKITLPEILSVALAHDLSDHWTLLAQVNWFGWDTFDSLIAVRDDGTIAQNIEQDYQPSRSYAAGVEYHINEDLTLRAGYQYDETPTVDEFRTTRTPDGDRHHFGAGFSYDVTDKIAVNASGMYGLMASENINLSRNNGLAQVSVRREDTNYVFVSLGLAYKF